MEGTNGASNGNGHSTATNGRGQPTAGPPIPGPLGIEAASLKGKVALVTGSGRLLECHISTYTISQFFLQEEESVARWHSN